MTKDEFLEIIEKVKQDDREALDILCRESYRFIRAWTSRTIRPDDVDDVIQETYIRLITSIKKFRGDSQYTTWLYGVVSNVCKDWKRKESKYCGQKTDSNQTRSCYQEHSNIIIDSILKDIKEPTRTIITLKVKGWKFRDIAEDMETTIDSVLCRYKRGIKALRSTHLKEWSKI